MCGCVGVKGRGGAVCASYPRGLTATLRLGCFFFIIFLFTVFVFSLNSPAGVHSCRFISFWPNSSLL